VVFEQTNIAPPQFPEVLRSDGRPMGRIRDSRRNAQRSELVLVRLVSVTH